MVFRSGLPSMGRAPLTRLWNCVYRTAKAASSRCGSDTANPSAEAFRPRCLSAGVRPSAVIFYGGGKMATALVNGFGSAGSAHYRCLSTESSSGSSMTLANGKVDGADKSAIAFQSRCLAAGVRPSPVVVIGGGKMATALVNGFVAAGIFGKADVAVSVKTEKETAPWKANGFENIFTDNSEMLRKFGNGIVFLSVKPGSRESLFSSLNKNSLADTSLIITVMGGVKVAVVDDFVAQKGYHSGVVRWMPNTPAAVGAAASVICASPLLLPSKVEIAVAMAKTIGLCVEVDEGCFDTAGVIAGCGPAFIYTVIDAMADGGVLGGLSRTAALSLAAQSVMGAARMVLVSKEHPGKLKDDVCSPGGITIYGMRELDRHGVRSAFIEAVNASTKRSACL